MASALAVAERFRELSDSRLTPLQLLKLVYIAHGWSFPIRGEGLIDDRIEAWQYGPVIPDLYHKLKAFRGDPVDKAIVRPREQIGDDEPEAELIDMVYRVYGDLTGGQLSAMTHRPDTPWDLAWRKGRNSRITDGMIRKHYEQLNDERNG